MSDLDFALDGLYAAGWWPAQRDRCLQAPDHRWYPAPETIRAAFADAGIMLMERSGGHEHLLTLSWAIPGHGWESATARSRAAAYLLAYTHLYQAEKRLDDATIGL